MAVFGCLGSLLSPRGPLWAGDFWPLTFVLLLKGAPPPPSQSQPHPSNAAYGTHHNKHNPYASFMLNIMKLYQINPCGKSIIIVKIWNVFERGIGSPRHAPCQRSFLNWLPQILPKIKHIKSIFNWSLSIID